MTAQVMTVLGPIPADRSGITLPHEQGHPEFARTGIQAFC